MKYLTILVALVACLFANDCFARGHRVRHQHSVRVSVSGGCPGGVCPVNRSSTKTSVKTTVRGAAPAATNQAK